MTLFDRCLNEVILYETGGRADGGYTNDPRDPGGETRWGISKRAYPDVDIKNLTRAGAVAIYTRDYWTPLGCADLPPALAFAVFDGGVNQGITAAALDLQKAVGVPQDGIVGPKTIGAALAVTPTDALLAFLAARGVRYAFSRNLSTYASGWYGRLTRASFFAFRLMGDA